MVGFRGVVTLALFMSWVFWAAGASGEILSTKAIRDTSEVKGRFNLILYGARHSNDIETLAVLDLLGDGYEMVPRAPEYDYKVLEDVPAEDALEQAEKFVRHHRSVNRVRTSRVVGPGGAVVGYEIRPLYLPLDFGQTDVMYVSYWTGGKGNIIFRIWLKPSVQRVLDGDDRERPGRMR